MTREELIASVEAQLSPRRFQHTKGVAATARRLAAMYGEDENKAEIVGWIHDVAREWPEEKVLRYAEDIEIPNGFAVMPKLLHGPVAARLLSERYGIHDEDMANAICYHTTGRVGMSPLEKIVALADSIEPGRNYAGVEELREAAEENLNLALARSLDAVIVYLIERHQSIFPLTVMARNDLWEQYQRQEESQTGGRESVN